MLNRMREALNNKKGTLKVANLLSGDNSERKTLESNCKEETPPMSEEASNNLKNFRLHTFLFKYLLHPEFFSSNLLTNIAY